MSVSHGHFLYVCLWLDHYLHQHDESGPIGSMWLGGIATYTTARDWCTKMIFYPSVTVARCFHLVLWVLEYAFIGMLGYHVLMMLVYLLHSFIMVFSI